MADDELTDGVCSGAVATASATASTIPVTGFVGVVSPFDGNQEEWIEYAERLEHNFTANDIVDVPKRRAILLNGVGVPTYRLIKTLSLPGNPKDLTFEEIVEKVKSHFNPKPCIAHSEAVRVQHETTERKRASGRIRSHSQEDHRTLRVWHILE